MIVFRLVAASTVWTLIAFGPARAVAQYNTAELTGVVRDAQGGVLAGAMVIAVHAATGARIQRVTDVGGRFFLPALPIGQYALLVESRGFKTFTSAVVLAVGQTLELSVTLTVGVVSETVNISAELPLLQVGSAEISDVIENRQVVQLPLNGRQFLQLAQLADGVVVPPGGTRGAALEQAGALPAVYGQRSGHNIYLLDGVKVTDEFFNNLVVSPSIDAIEEFKIQKTMYPAEFGGKASALINVVTRSGGNAFRAGAVVFGRSDRFDARNYFDDPSAPVPPLAQRHFGAHLGGPIVRGRAFFFASYEGQRIERSLTQTFSVPASAFRTGDFSSLGPICDPLTRVSGGGCTAFAGNRIPPSRFSPVAVALLRKMPEPNRAGSVQNLVSVENQSTSMDQVTVRVDHRLSTRDNVYARFTSYDVGEEQPFGTSLLNETLVPGFGRMVTTASRNLAVGHTHLFGDSVVNEIRFGFLDVRGGQMSPNQGVGFAGTSGLQGVTAHPADLGYPQVSFGGQFSTIGDPTSFVSRVDRSYELYDNVIIDRGRHHWKFGGYLFRLEFNPVNPTTARGAFAFNGQWTGNAFADFLLGYPSAAQVGIGRADEHGRSTWVHLYAQDDWKPASSLTLNYGLRYEINGQMTDIDNRLSAIDLAVPGGRFVIASDDSGNISPSAAPLLPQMPIPWVTSREAGWTRGLLRPSYLRFAPRAGLAWRIGGGKSVINAGFGVFLNQWAYSVQQALAQTLPFFFAKAVNAAADAIQPAARTENMLLAPSNGTIGGSTMDHEYRTEYAKNYSVSFQCELRPSTMMAVTFLRSAVVGADSSTVLNVPEPGPGPIGPRRPVPALANITAIRWDGYSVYNGVTVRVEQRLAHGLAFSASYGLSKSVDDASDPGPTSHETNLPQNVRDMGAERALASFDHRHRFAASVTYVVPAPHGRGWRSSLGSGWQASAIVALQSGAPFTAVLGTDRANIGSGPAQRPDATCDPNEAAPRTPERWFNTACFALPAAYTFGSAGRNTVIAPGHANVDAALHRTIELSGRVRLELRWEIFNLFNRANFDVPNRIAFTPNFGRIFSAGPARQMQLGAKVTF